MGRVHWAGDGDRPLVVSYATSPAAEVYFSEGAIEEPPTGNVLGAGACFRQIEFIGILDGTQNRDLAEKLVDFMLSQRFQEDIPLQMFVFPAHAGASLPDFYQWAERPAATGPGGRSHHPSQARGLDQTMDRDRVEVKNPSCQPTALLNRSGT